MTSAVRIVFTNGRSIKCKIIGQRLSWIIVRKCHKKVYYPEEQVRRINYQTVEDFGFQSEVPELGAMK